MTKLTTVCSIPSSLRLRWLLIFSTNWFDLDRDRRGMGSAASVHRRADSAANSIPRWHGRVTNEARWSAMEAGSLRQGGPPSWYAGRSR